MYFDGLCIKKQGVLGGLATFGVAIYKDGRTLKELYDLAAQPWSSEATSNVAEYRGMLEGLKWLVEQGLTENVEVLGDSQLVINQMRGEFRIRAENLKPLYAYAKDLASHFKTLQFTWIDREKNKEADSLCWRAYHEYHRSNKRAPV